MVRSDEQMYEIQQTRMTMKRYIRRLFSFPVLPAAIVMVIGPVGCDESLPPRIEPAVVLVPSISVLRPVSIAIRDSMPVGTAGAFEARVLNVYDDVLQDTARIRLNLELWLANQPEHRATITATEEDLVNYRILQGKVLTLGIDTAAIIRKQWNHRTSEGVFFWEIVPLYTSATPGGDPFCESDTVRFRVKGTVQVFNIVQPQILPEWEFRIVYRVFGINCPPPPPPSNYETIPGPSR
jgi:hypothetical protein